MSSASEVLKSLARPLNTLGAENKVQRRKALEHIRAETIARNIPLEKDQLQAIGLELHRKVLVCLSDESEKCRELSLDILKDLIVMCPNPLVLLPAFMPMFVDRLGQVELVEESEEIRLSLVQTLCVIIDLAQQGVAQFLNDYIKVLQQTIKDGFAEVKKESCKCASKLAKTIPAYFHQHSENLINPLLTQISHQHSKVRVAVIACLGDVIRFGNNKSVEDVISHFAQRIFDPIPAVRLALTNVMGDWMLNLPDRYSFWHRMIPLLLSAVDDSHIEVANAAVDFWRRAGRQFEEENEQELKDKLDFSVESPAWYPEGVERPCIGCRVLIYRNFGKFIHGIQNDIGDWGVETRIKTASLLYQCLLNVEDSVTQFLAKVFSALQKGALDEDKQVKKYIAACAEMIGYFVNPESWCKILLPVVKAGQNHAGLIILANIIRGSQPDILKHYLEDVVSTCASDDVCRCYQQSSYLLGLQSFVAELCRNQVADVEVYKQELFDIVITSMALSIDAETRKHGYHCLEILSQCLMCEVADLYSQCTSKLLERLSDKNKLMSSSSSEFLLFEGLVLSAGASVGVALPEVMHMFKLYLEPDKEPELRLKFLTVLCKLVLTAGETLNSQGQLSLHSMSLAKDVLMPNLIWKAGRTNEATRTSTITALWAILEGEFISKHDLRVIAEEMVPCLTSMLDEDSTTARIIATKALGRLISTTSLDPDELHKVIPDLIKRLDDRENSVRLKVTETLIELSNALPNPYNSGLYRAHCENMYEGLLIHLDDPDLEIQDAVFEVLKASLRLCPDSLRDSINSVKHRHRTPTYCNSLLEEIDQRAIVGDQY
ncbi:dynein axonemal assembly factor 5-like [Symsagittifera roscoffensis]|uniref:dynein axonemal assembly factor 5-like n=1 Tax=Symsagittifera roscoffensis TaxID=84072 RepID=UPI00307C5261